MNMMKLIREGKVKRCLRARNKLNFPGLVSHITQHASGRDCLFVEEVDYLYFLKILKEIAEEFSISVFSFCLMTNHLHLLLRQGKKNLSEAMHNLFMRYAFYFNNKYFRKGHLFSGAFRQAACFDNYYLLASSVYIHLNPVRAGLVGDYSHYRWSSWRLYCQEKEWDTFIDWRFILWIIDEDILLAKTKYRMLLGKALHYKSKEILEAKRELGKLGIWMRKRFPELLRTRQPASGSGSLLADGYASDAELAEVINKLSKRKRLTNPTEIEARKFAVEQLKSRGFSIQEIADYMGTSVRTIYAILRKK